MIASVTGKVAAVGREAAIRRGRGSRPGTFLYARRLWPACGSVNHASLSTSLVVRETELTLYGFGDADEREVFEALQSAAGVGPRSWLRQCSPCIARMMSGVPSPPKTSNALCKVSGIGKKGAARIVLDLKDKLGPPNERQWRAAAPSSRCPRPGQPAWEEQLRGALDGSGLLRQRG